MNPFIAKTVHRSSAVAVAAAALALLALSMLVPVTAEAHHRCWHKSTCDTTSTTSLTSAALSGTAGDKQVSLSWTASSDSNGIDRYEVVRDGGVVAVVSASTLSYTDSGLTNGQSYSYSVVAYNTTGNSASSNSVTLTPSSPTSADFPADYFSGPLGQNNVLPASQDGALLAVQPGFSGATQQSKIDRLGALQTAARRRIDVVGHHYGGGGTFGGHASCAYTDDDTMMNWSVNNGSAIYLTWTPSRSTADGGSTLRQIINGNRDGCIDAMAAHLKGKNVRVMLRIFPEFDFLQYHKRGDGTLDYTTEATQGQAVIDAWRRVVGRFQAAGASNVGFFWSPDEGGGSRAMVGYAYPGNSYVDWVGSDRYNHSGTNYSACRLQGWADFHRIFNHTTEQCGGEQNFHDRFGVTNNKPFFVGETSTKYDDATPSRKNDWYANIAKAKDPADTVRYMSNLIGVSLFDQYIVEETNADWRIDSNQTAAMKTSGTLGTQSPAHGLDGWVTWAGDPRWNVGAQ